MTAVELIKTKFSEGTWEGVLTGATTSPQLKAQHMGQEIDAPEVSVAGDAAWNVRLTLPGTVLADGVQTVVIADAQSGEQLAAINVIAGEPLDDDLRAEVQLLREELDMLKRAFRRHCVETS